MLCSLTWAGIEGCVSSESLTCATTGRQSIEDPTESILSVDTSIDCQDIVTPVHELLQKVSSDPRSEKVARPSTNSSPPLVTS